MSARDRLPRIVQLIAELTRREREGQRPMPIDEAAELLGVTRADVAADILVLGELGDRVDADWLLSLAVSQDQGRIAVSSAGPFQRPLTLTPGERQAIQIALALDLEGAALAKRLAGFWDSKAETASQSRQDQPEAAHAGTLVRRAAAARHQLLLRYAADGDSRPTEWTVDVHQVAEYRGRTYLIAWVEATGGWRHFRLDRTLEVRVTDKSFELRPDFAEVRSAADLFRPGGNAESVTVKFSSRVAPWVRRRYPDHVLAPDGSVTVSFTVANPRWLLRRVLEYGADVEVLAPARYRAAVREAVSGAVESSNPR